MTARRFRFRPPAIDAAVANAGLDWTLSRAFASSTLPVPGMGGGLEIAERLGLLPRIVGRLDDNRLGAELGAASVDVARAARARAMARELSLDASLGAVAEAAAPLGLAPIVLKGRALVLAGHSAAGCRPSGDIDLLVPEEGLDLLCAELRRRGFDQAPGAGYEHQLSPLRHPHGELVELHRHLPGVRLEGRSFATWHDLSRAGLTEAPADRRFAALRVPTRELLVAHALVHALAQHGLSARAPGWLLIADLIDLEAAASSADGARAPWAAWIERELSDHEIAVALALSERAAAGALALEAEDDAALLGRHFTASALDAVYGEALKTRWLESPVSERTRLGARARLLLRAFVPPRRGELEDSVGAVRCALRWLWRPFELLAKALGAARAQGSGRVRKGKPRDPSQC